MGKTSRLTQLARRLRVNQSDAEKKLWRAIRSNQVFGAKFKRQVPVSPYIVDFYCEEANLIVEVDGGQHMERIEEDEVRTQFLESRGNRVARFTNIDVLTNLEGVLEVIGQRVNERR
ncbi:MAG: endonuclease domain-containing protein [Chloroflexi bacterium]|nr:MAG: endonuclease domain-containing protein [Chloroflexota bacterium]